MNKKPLPFLKIYGYPRSYLTTGTWRGDDDFKIPGFFLTESDAEAFRELTRRVIKREAFTEYAEKIWKEIFDERK